MADQVAAPLALPGPLPAGIAPVVALAVAIDVVVSRCGLPPLPLLVQAEGDKPRPAGRGLPQAELHRPAEALLRARRSASRPEAGREGEAATPTLVRIGPGGQLACEPPGRVIDAEAGWSTSTLLRRALAWLRCVVTDPAVPSDVPSLLLEGERDQLLTTWNDTERDWGPFKPVHADIERVSLGRPDRTAVVFGSDRWSYERLRRETARCRLALERTGVGPGSTVAVHLDRQPVVVAALLAVLESGAAYLPVEPGLPPARVSAMLEDAVAGCVLTTRAGATQLPRSAGAVVCVEDLPRLKTGPELPPPADVAPADTAYIIFTSGSTGGPKGVRCTHAGLRNRLLWMQQAFRLEERDIVLHKTPLGFDVSMWELLWPFLAGAQMAIAEPGGHRDPAYLAALIRQAGVTVAHFVPSMLDVFLEEPSSVQCRSLRVVVASGEELTRPTVERFHRRLAASLHNLYGPTEASIDVSHHACRPGEAGRVPIGRPIANTTLLVLDRHGALVPGGGVGELCIGGVGLADGYTDPDLTASRFIPNPHPRGGRRLYRTGDQVRQRPDGELVFLGRLDDQIKLRGVRLELGEVEAVLRAHPGVARAAAVVVAEDSSPRLEAFVVPTGGSRLDPEALLDHCRRVLPAAAVPTRVHLAEGFPLSANGKLARSALVVLARLRPAPPLAGATREDANGWSGAVRAAWASVTGNEPAPDVDLVASGGDSLTAMRILARLRGRTGASVRVADFLARPTPGALTALAERAAPSGRDQPAVPSGDGPVRLTGEQSRIWLADRLEAGDSAYTLCCGVRLPTIPDEERLRRVVAEITTRHPVLRSVVRLDDEGELLMVEGDGGEPDLLVLHRETDAAPRALRRFARSPFEMDRRPPFRWCVLHAGAATWVYLAGHHVLIDGWSWQVLAGELVALLGDGPGPLPVPPSFLDYARRTMPAPLASARSRTDEPALAMWTEHLGSKPAVLAEQFLGAATRLRFEETCRAIGVTPHAGLLALLAGQVARRAGTRLPDVTVTATFSGRDEPGWEETVGCFVRAAPVRLEVGSRAPLAALGPAAHAAVLQRLDRSAGVDELPSWGRSVLGAVLTLQNTPLAPGLRHRDLTEVSSGRTKYGLRLDVAPWNEGWSVAVERPRGASPGAEELAAEYCDLVAWAAADATADLLAETLPGEDRSPTGPSRFVA